MQLENLELLPAEMREREQWCIAGDGKKPCLVTETGVQYDASPVVGPWFSFEQAVKWAKHHNTNVGYIITEGDGLSCIDMDVKDAFSRDAKGVPFPKELWTGVAELEWYSGIVALSGSYCEMSAGGKGVHCWVKGDIGAGRRGKGIEVYSRERFIVCTGNAVSDVQYKVLNGVALPRFASVVRAVKDGQRLLDNCVAEIGGSIGNSIELVDVQELHSDERIWEMARKADNSEKFLQLCEGDWESDFPSQSEADLALMSIFTFYTKSNEQCRRLFRLTHLGARPKAVKNDVYLDRTLKIIRGRQAKDALSEVRIDLSSMMEVMRLKNEAVKEEVVDIASAVQQMQGAAVSELVAPFDTVPKVKDGITWPPGMVGSLASFIYHSSPRPVVEVAVTAALGLMAGIVGKAYHTETLSGLNLYIILIARSAIGKESMHSGISSIMHNVNSRTPAGGRFVSFDNFVSGPALTKGCAESSSFVNVSGEWGRKLKRLAMEENKEGPMQQLRTVMTDLYQKSGPTSTVGGMAYSKKENDTKAMGAVAYSMIGETTPGTFYESLTPSMMEDGFLSRFNIIRYTGERPPANPNMVLSMDDRLCQLLVSIMNNCSRMNDNKQSVPVRLSPEAYKVLGTLGSFDLRCDAEINASGDNETRRQMWNRAHLKALRISSVLAVSDNFTNPIVSIEHCNWAVDLILHDISVMDVSIASGDVGLSDSSMMLKMMQIFKEYVQKSIPESYNIPKEMAKVGLVPLKYLHVRIPRLAVFNKHRLGSTVAMSNTLRSAVEAGYIAECDKHEMLKEYNFTGKVYKIVSMPQF